MHLGHHEAPSLRCAEHMSMCVCQWYVQDLPLAGFDREAAAFVMEQYKQRGIRYHGQASPTAISKGDNGKLTVRVEPYKREGEPFEITDVDQASGACLSMTPLFLN